MQLRKVRLQPFQDVIERFGDRPYDGLAAEKFEGGEFGWVVHS
ncbi:MAG: hypothetical protein AAFY46_11450 [Planctomycetota bacterium]